MNLYISKKCRGLAGNLILSVDHLVGQVLILPAESLFRLRVSQ